MNKEEEFEELMTKYLEAHPKFTIKKRYVLGAVFVLAALGSFIANKPTPTPSSLVSIDLPAPMVSPIIEKVTEVRELPIKTPTTIKDLTEGFELVSMDIQKDRFLVYYRKSFEDGTGYFITIKEPLSNLKLLVKEYSDFETAVNRLKK